MKEKEKGATNPLYSIVFISVILCDQVTKLLAYKYLMPVGSIDVLGDWVRLTYAENTGAAFSQFEGRRYFLILTTITFLTMITWLGFNSRQKSEKILLTLLAAGGCGNLIDRVLRGKVIDFVDCDFINIYFPPFSLNAQLIMDRWPVFNVADMCISISAVLLVFYYVWVEKK